MVVGWLALLHCKPSMGGSPQLVDPMLDALGLGSDDARFNEVQQKSIHNSFEQDEGIVDQLRVVGVRSLELDVHNSKFARGNLDGDWYVYHADAPLLDDSRCERLSDCLAALADFHAANPHHAPVTIFIDLKDEFRLGQSPRDLDRRLRVHFGEDALLTPRDLLAACPGATTLREAVRAPCGWPRLGSMHGRFLFVLTGGSSCRAGTRLDDYGSRGSEVTTAFIAPDVDDDCDLASYGGAADTLFFNLDWAHRSISRAVHWAGGISRVYYGGLTGGLNTASVWNDAKAGLANFLVTDRLRWP
jgi:hypothetical protein